MTIGQRIRFFREKAGYTQNALAHRVNVSPQAVSKWETSGSLPDITLLPALADALETSCDALLLDESQERAQTVEAILARSHVLDRDDPAAWREMVALLEDAVRRYPRSCPLLLRLGEVYSYEDGYGDKAIACLERVRTLHPAPPELYAATQLLCYLYGYREPEKTLALAGSMPELYQTRLALLYHGYAGAEKRAWMGAYFHALLDTAETIFHLSAEEDGGKSHFDAIRAAYGTDEHI